MNTVQSQLHLASNLERPFSCSTTLSQFRYTAASLRVIKCSEVYLIWLRMNYKLSISTSDNDDHLELISTGDPLESNKNYIVGGWGSINPNVKGPKIFNLLENYITKSEAIEPKSQNNVKILGM